MAFCIQCGSHLPDGSAFCSFCGAKQSEAQTPVARQTSEDVSSRLTAISELEKLHAYFDQKASLYYALDKETADVERLSKGASKKLLTFGIIIAVFGGLPMLGELQNIGDVNLFGLFILLGIMGVGVYMIYVYMQKRDRYAAELEQAYSNIDKISAQLMQHYEAYGFCPIGAEYSDPRVIKQLTDIMKAGRADTIKESISVLLDDRHKTAIEINTAMTAESAADAARSAKSAARSSAATAIFSAANFISRL